MKLMLLTEWVGKLSPPAAMKNLPQQILLITEALKENPAAVQGILPAMRPTTIIIILILPKMPFLTRKIHLPRLNRLPIRRRGVFRDSLNLRAGQRFYRLWHGRPRL